MYHKVLKHKMIIIKLVRLDQSEPIETSESGLIVVSKINSISAFSAEWSASVISNP